MKRALHGSLSLYLGLLTLCCSQIAGAQELRHRDYFFGDRAMGLSGATTALATDPSSALYNPAGLPLGRDRTFTGSMIVLDQQSMTLTNGLRVHPESGVQRDLRSRASGLYPYSGEALSKLAEGHYLAIASFIPFNRTMQFSDRGLSLIEGKTHAALNRFYSRESRRLTGPVYGGRLSSTWSVGMGVFYSRYVYDRSSTSSAFIADELNMEATTWTVLGQSGAFHDTRILTGGLAMTLGTLYRGQGGFGFGVVLSLPVIPIHSSLDLEFQEINYVDSKLITSELTGEGSVREPTPMELRIGMSYENHRIAVGLDVSYFAAFDYFNVELPQGFSKETGVDPAIPLGRRARSIINSALGFEYKFTTVWSSRLGGFTNQSSSPDIPSIIADEAYSPQIDEYGFTFGTGYRGSKGEIQLAFGVALGEGHMVARHPTRTGILPSRESVESSRFFVALGGAVSFVKKRGKKEQKQSP